MADAVHRCLRADDRSYFALLKKEVHARAVACGCSAHRLGEVDIVVAELATNLVKHASGGQILVKNVEERGVPGVELIAIDSGPGMHDVNRMMGDGVSTKNTIGGGMGAMSRLADLFQVFSQRGWGTVTLIRMFATPLPAPPPNPTVEIRSLLLPKPGETECGDGFYQHSDAQFLRLFVGDGLGHGPEAARAVQAAGAAFLECTDNDPGQIIRHINETVRKTRGLVGTVALFDRRQKEWRMCGVGNIATRIITAAGSRNYMSYNGIIGHNVPRTLNAQVVPWEKGQHLVLCSDGVRSRWDLVRYPSLLRNDLSLVAGVIYKEFSRNTDDLSVVGCKIMS